MSSALVYHLAALCQKLNILQAPLGLLHLVSEFLQNIGLLIRIWDALQLFEPSLQVAEQLGQLGFLFVDIGGLGLRLGR